MIEEAILLSCFLACLLVVGDIIWIAGEYSCPVQYYHLYLYINQCRYSHPIMHDTMTLSHLDSITLPDAWQSGREGTAAAIATADDV